MDPQIFETATEVVGSLFDRIDDRLYIYVDSVEGISALIDHLHDQGNPRTVRLLLPESNIPAIKSDYLLAGKLADLKSGSLQIRTTTAAISRTLVCTANRNKLVGVERVDRIFAIRDIRSSLLKSELIEQFFQLWESATSLEHEIIGIDELLEAARREFGIAFVADLSSALCDHETYPLDEWLDLSELVTVLAAKNLYSVSKIANWCDEIGLCSYRTINRVVNDLESEGVITTEQENTDGPGRPSRRLSLASSLSQQKPHQLPQTSNIS